MDPIPEFVPEQINLGTRSGRRLGKGATTGGVGVGGEDDVGSGGGGGKESSRVPNNNNKKAAHDSTISDSVVFADFDNSGSLFDSDDENDPIPTTDECVLFDEIDEMNPHDINEGGEFVSDRHDSVISTSGSHARSNGYMMNSLIGSTSRSHASSLPQSLLGGNGVAQSKYDALGRSTNDNSLAEMIAKMEGRMKSSTTLLEGGGEKDGKDHHVRESIVGGIAVSDMSFEERRQLFAPQRSAGSLVVDIDSDDEGGIYKDGGGKEAILSYSPAFENTSSHGGDNNNNIVSSVDWNSLSRSCKLAKNAFQDPASGKNVVRNMFKSHLRPLTAVLTLYARRHCGRGTDHRINDEPWSLTQIKALTTETKGALLFAMSCLAPPSIEDAQANKKTGQGADGGSSEERDGGVERYRIARQFRQELQEATVRGFAERASSYNLDDDRSERSASSRHHFGLQIPLAEIINYGVSCPILKDYVSSHSVADVEERAKIVSSIERGRRRVRILAARLLCNIVTDSPLAAGIVLRDVPFSPKPDLINARMAGSVLGIVDDTRMVFWSDLVVNTAKVHTSDDKGGRGGEPSEDREVLAAVAAALHNLLTSLEARESLLELDDEMKRRERSKKRREELLEAAKLRQVGDPVRDSAILDEKEDHSEKPIDVDFEIASNGVLLNALLRSILPVKAILVQSSFEMGRKSMSRPKLKPPISPDNDVSVIDSATEWISLLLERIASRGLLPKMLMSAGGTSNSITPEQVVLVSCIRQAVDVYDSSISTWREGVTSRPHPLWGRADSSASGWSSSGGDSRTAVPVLLSLANEVEDIRLRADALRQGHAESYDGEEDCTIRVIDDLCDILAQCLGRHAGPNANGNEGSKRCFIVDARSVLGRETSLISSCCKDLGRIVDRALVSNSGRKTRELMLSPQDQQTAIIMVRLIGNIVYQCRYNQDLLRVTPTPVLEVDVADKKSTSSIFSNLASSNATTRANNGLPIERTGLHVVLSATSLAPACFTLREWCVVAIRNAVEGNDANAATVSRLEANQVLSDTPELRQMGVKIDMDAKGNVRVNRTASGQEPRGLESDQINWA